MIEAVGVSVGIEGRAIVDAVDLTLRPSRVTVLIGPNGAGKSTLLRVMSGERQPDRGVVRLNGRQLRSFRPAVLARHRAVLEQSVTTAFAFRVEEVVSLGIPREIRPVQAAGLASRGLAAVGLKEAGCRIISTLSGGEQQRVHLARVLVQLWAQPASHAPGCLMLDEPTAGLDPAHQILALKLARAHAEAGGGVLAVLHDLNLAAMVADEVVALDHGRVVASGRPDEVITDALMRGVYGVDIKVRDVPPGVFVLPQTAASSDRLGIGAG